MEEFRPQHPYFRYYNRNPWKSNIPDCAIRATSLATRLPYVDVCRRLRVSFKNGHGLIRNSGIFLKEIKRAFDDYFDIVVDFDEYISPENLHGIDFETIGIFDDECAESGVNNEINLVQWMNLNRGQGLFIVGLHNATNNEGHVVYASTLTMKFFDTWDCSDYKVDAWMRVKKQER